MGILNNCISLDLYSDAVSPTLRCSPDRINLGNIGVLSEILVLHMAFSCRAPRF